MSAMTVVRTMIKLSANENPLGISPKALAALRKSDTLHIYPNDDTYPEVRKLLAVRCGIDATAFALGHGSNELISLACQAFLQAGDEVVMARPTFSLYPRFVAAQGAIPVEVPLRDGVHDIAAMLAAITPKTRMLVVCDPNNPTGTIIQTEDWLKLLAGIPDDVLLLVDQAYVEFVLQRFIEAADIVQQRPKTLVLRTLSKLYGLASLRFGYGFGDPATIAAINAMRAPYNVNRVASIAAKAALTDGEFVERSLRANMEGRAYLSAAFETLQLHVFPTQANFFSVATPIDADQACADLATWGVLVRSGNSLAMPGRIRITIGTQTQNEELVAALHDLLPSWNS